MAAAVADRGTRARLSVRTPQDAAGERLPLVVAAVAVVVFAAAWLLGLIPALNEEGRLQTELLAAQRLEQHVRTQLEDRRDSARAFAHDPEELLRAMDETRTLPPAVPQAPSVAGRPVDGRAPSRASAAR